MLTNQLTRLLATTCILLATACGESKDGEGTTVQDGSASADASSTESDTNTMSDSDTETASNSASEDESVTNGSESDPTADDTSGGGDCTAEDECRMASDCPGGGDCLGCICVGGEETGPGGDDPYPPPMNGMCPEGYGSLDPEQVMGQVCAPPCEGQGMCPEPTSGTAMGACAIVPPGGSMDPCETPGEPCPDEPEVCLMFADGAFCTNPPMWCYLNCSGGATCPDGQMCNAMGICVWPE